MLLQVALAQTDGLRRDLDQFIVIDEFHRILQRQLDRRHQAHRFVGPRGTHVGQLFALDLVVNPIKGKQLTNVRASGTDEAVRLTTPIKMSLEYAVEFIDDDELVEITPVSVRVRKRHLNEQDRKKALRGLL